MSTKQRRRVMKKASPTQLAARREKYKLGPEANAKIAAEKRSSRMALGIVTVQFGTSAALGKSFYVEYSPA